MAISRSLRSPSKFKSQPHPGQEVWFESSPGMQQRCVVIGCDPKTGLFKVVDVGHLHEAALRDLTPVGQQDRAASSVKKLVQLAKRKGVTTTDLDVVIHDLASSSAATANNDGLVGQVRWLVEQCGADEAKRLIEEAAE